MQISFILSSYYIIATRSYETTDLKRPPRNFSWQFCFQGEGKQINSREACACGVCIACVCVLCVYMPLIPSKLQGGGEVCDVVVNNVETRMSRALFFLVQWNFYLVSR